ncbi:uncharacterized protein EI90DRAFT_3040587 [Cantharellus anzutake]|uniref:uncharacterized protein n=1 Tax=Cantharellus anzutake TaxID=1750568 RepID=UPI001908CE5A|nr:uncharacterized protein EI90DRAFT_3040587 [Cantharellus anzutake]KAF8339141.1 hypothetical protein EI90DRAFT_3040587 [Cantharellus anzutake]
MNGSRSGLAPIPEARNPLNIHHSTTTLHVTCNMAWSDLRTATLHPNLRSVDTSMSVLPHSALL